MKTLQEYGLHHTGFIVRNVEEAAEHFKKNYGVKAAKPYEFKPNKAWSYGTEVDNYCLKISMITMDNGSTIELIEPISGEGVHRDFLEAGQHGLHHICFGVDEYDYWKSYFLKIGHAIIFESETEDEQNGYRRCFYAKDQTAGMVYEIKENPYFRKGC